MPVPVGGATDSWSYPGSVQHRILLAVTVAVILGLVVGAILQRNGSACEDWQEEYTRVAEEGRGGVLAFINEGPFAERLRELEKERPKDCPKPEL